MNSFGTIESVIGYNFKDKNLLKTAITHQSYANEQQCDSYERLEFLGDSIIEFVVSEYIYNNFNFEVGVLTKLRASLVSTDYLYNISKELELDRIALKSKSLTQLGKKNIADLFESVVGAVFVDGGIENATQIIEKYIIKDMNNVRYVLKNSIDYKTKFQETMQHLSKHFEYRHISSSGLDHEKMHTVGLWIEGEKITEHTSSSKQLAEEKCAEFYIKNFTDFKVE